MVQYIHFCRITIANADFALTRGDAEEALSLLRNVDEENPYYIQAKEKMSEIYLTKRYTDTDKPNGPCAVVTRAQRGRYYKAPGGSTPAFFFGGGGGCLLLHLTCLYYSSSPEQRTGLLHDRCIFPSCNYVCVYRKDKKMYIACFEELAKKLPGPPTSLILGDAYMNVQEVYII